MTTTDTTRTGLRFYETSHRYKLDGAWVPGVTTILNVIDKPGLKKWAAETVATYVTDNPTGVDTLRSLGRDPMIAALKGIPWQKRDTAATRGTTFHDLAERIINGEDVEVPEPQVPLVESALAFLHDYDIEPTLVEAVVGSRKHQYAGKLDLIANGAIWDWKSGKRIYPSTAFQLAGYANAEFYGEGGDEHELPPVTAAYGVHIREDGYDVYPLEFGHAVFDEFLCIRRAFEINRRAEGDWRNPGTGYVGVPVTTTEVA